MNIMPVQVFGGLISFGTIVLRLFSFSLIPAYSIILEKAVVHESHEKHEQIQRASCC